MKNNQGGDYSHNMPPAKMVICLPKTHNVCAFSVSLVTTAVVPFIFLIRRLNSLFRGYEEGSDYDCGIGGPCSIE